MASKLNFDETELACRLLPQFVNKAELTTGHAWQEYAPIGRRTCHARLVRLEFAEIEKGKYGSIMLRRGPKWAFDVGDDARIQRDRAVVERLEIRAWLRPWFQPKAPGNSDKVRVWVIRSRLGAAAFKADSNIIPFRKTENQR